MYVRYVIIKEKAEFAMKDKIMILGGANLHCKLVEAAHQMEKETIVVDNVKNSPAKLISDYSYDIDVKDVDRLADICRNQNIKAVLSAYLDFCQPYYQKLCSLLNCPCFGTDEQFKIFTDKELFKKKCLEYGVNTIKGYTEKELQSLDVVEYPIYIKPSISQGSKGQCVCYNKEEALRAINGAKMISKNGKVIIEKYMAKKHIIQVTYLVLDGIPKLIRTADQINGSDKYGMQHIAIAGISPSKYTNLFLKKVNHKIKNMIKHIGIKNSPVFMQGFVDEDDFYFFDPGLRFPGTEASRIFKNVMNIDLMQAMIEFSFSGKILSLQNVIDEDTVYLKNYIILNLFPFIKKGKIKSISPIDNLLKINGVEYVTYRHKVGDVVDDTKDVNQRIAEINILGTTKEKINNTIKDVYDILQVLDVKGNNMILDRFILK